MAKIFTARRTGELLGLPHLEVIRRLRRGDIRGQKLGWNWIITEDAIEEAKQSDWYQRRLAKLAAQREQPAAAS